MSITTNAELEAKVASYLARSDLTSYIPDFIVGAETRIAYGSDEPFPSQALRCRAMEEESSISVGATTPLPTGFLQMRSFYATSGGVKQQLEQTSHEDLFRKWTGSTTGTPRVYALSGDNIVLGPAPSTGTTYSATMLYYKKFDPVATASPVPWLLTNAPLVYVYGALLEAAPFIRNDARIQLWHGLFTGLIGGLMRSDRRDRWGGTALAVRNDTGNP
jgi:hypothetical protein